jgi:hypothetical protein
MKSVTFFTIHQAPHNTFTFKGIDKHFKIKVFYLKEKLSNYGWKSKDFYYNGELKNNFFAQIKTALSSDLTVVSGWHSIKYLYLYIFLFIFNKKYAVYLDLDIDSLRKYGFIKRVFLKNSPIIFITGTYGETFLRRYLNKKEVYNFPYGVKVPDCNIVKQTNELRKNEILNNDKIRVFISNRFIERKGYDIIESLIKYLVDKNLMDRFHFKIAGNGMLFDHISSKIKKVSDEIEFLGWIDYSEYLDQMSQCDVYLHCSDYEPFGIPPVDAFCWGKQIFVTSKVYSYYDVKRLGGNIISFDNKKPEVLNSLFLNLYKDSESLYVSNNKNDLFNSTTYLFENLYTTTIRKLVD